MLILSCLFFALFTYLIFYFIARKQSFSFLVISFFLNLYHYIFSLGFYFYSLGRPNDSLNYYIWGTEQLENFPFSSGTGFLVHLVHFINYILNSYENVFLFFSMISSWVILSFFLIIYNFYSKREISSNSFLFLTILLFIPGLHFWTVAIGKDCLVLLFISLFLYAYIYKKIKLLVFSLVFLALIRIHIFAIVFLTFIMHEFIYGNFKLKKISMGVYRFVIFVLSIPSIFVLYQFLFSFIQKYSEDGFSDIGGFVENRNEAYSEEGSGLLLASQPYILKMLAFVLGGLPWLSLDPLSLFSMAEGVIVIGILLYSYYYLFTKDRFNNSKQIFILIFIALFILFMPLISANLGIMVRMRVMLYIPILTVLLMFMLSNERKI
ncbi:hypothetical protein Q5X58_16595 [Acinetobacter baumannii]|nr:hypothetical protein [Acinetobacter baumannii]